MARTPYKIKRLIMIAKRLKAERDRNIGSHRTVYEVLERRQAPTHTVAAGDSFQK